MTQGAEMTKSEVEMTNSERVPTSRVPLLIIVCVLGVTLLVGQMAIGNAAIWAAIGLGFALLLVALPEVGLGLFLTAGTYKTELVTLLRLPADPTMLLGGLVLAGLFIRMLRQGVKSILPSRQLVVPFGVLLILMVFSQLAGEATLYGREKLLRFGLLTGIAVLATAGAIGTRARLRRFVATAVGLGLLMALLGTVTGEGLAAFGSTHIAAGRVLGFALLGVLYLFLESRPHALVRLGLLAALGLLGFGFFASGSRGSMVALLVSLAVTALVSFGLRKGRRWVGVGLVVFAGATAALSLAVPAAVETMNRRVTDVFENGDAIGSARSRVQRAEDAWALFLAHPVVGVGVGGFDQARGRGDGERGDYPHNILLEIGCELGLLGLAAFVFLVAVGLRCVVGAMRAVKGRQEFAVVALILAVTVYFLVNAMFSGDLNDNRLLFTALGLCPIAAGLAGEETMNDERGTMNDERS
jgi:O-antigen ligase